MTNSKSLGCGVWVILSAICLLMGIVFTSKFALNAAVSSSPLIATVIPQQSDTLFSVQDNQIVYSKRETLDLPCNYLIQGSIVDLEGKPVRNAVVNIRMVGDLAPKKLGYTFPGEGPENLGASAWLALLPNWNSNYDVWLTTTVGGKPISPVIFVETQGCDNNVATINFIQIRSMDK